MEFFNQEFVDREGPLSLLRQAVDQVNCQIVVIKGRAGIGKTALLKKFLDEVRGKDNKVAFIDLRQTVREQNYLTILTDIHCQLDYTGFNQFKLALKEARSELEPVQSLRAPRAPGPSPNIPPGDAENNDSQEINFNGPVTAPHSQFAATIYNIYNLYSPYSTPYEREVIRANITQAFIQDLNAINQRCKVLLALDHWEDANRETQDWLWDCLFQWTINQCKSVVAFVACQTPPVWHRRGGEIASIELLELPNDAVHSYWVQIRNLPEANLTCNLPMYAYPSLMVLAADELSRQIRQQH